jgi:hypothetical protein
MLFKRSHINRAASAMLLVILLLFHSVKLLHSHSSDSFCESSNSEIVKSSTDCSICNYQLSKDADDFVYPALREYEPQPGNFNIQLISFHKFSFHSAFENRGPPILI